MGGRQAGRQADEVSNKVGGQGGQADGRGKRKTQDRQEKWKAEENPMTSRETR